MSLDSILNEAEAKVQGTQKSTLDLLLDKAEGQTPSSNLDAVLNQAEGSVKYAKPVAPSAQLTQPGAAPKQIPLMQNVSQFPLSPSGRPQEQEVKRQLLEKARGTDVDTSFILSLVKHESSFNPSAASRDASGNPIGHGLGQFTTGTAQGLAKQTGKDFYNKALDIKNPDIDAQTSAVIDYASRLWKIYKGNKAKIAAAWNGGEGVVQSKNPTPMYDETINYVGNILIDIKAIKEKDWNTLSRNDKINFIRSSVDRTASVMPDKMAGKSIKEQADIIKESRGGIPTDETRNVWAGAEGTQGFLADFFQEMSAMGSRGLIPRPSPYPEQSFLNKAGRWTGHYVAEPALEAYLMKGLGFGSYLQAVGKATSSVPLLSKIPGLVKSAGVYSEIPGMSLFGAVDSSAFSIMSDLRPYVTGTKQGQAVPWKPMIGKAVMTAPIGAAFAGGITYGLQKLPGAIAGLADTIDKLKNNRPNLSKWMAPVDTLVELFEKSRMGKRVFDSFGANPEDIDRSINSTVRNNIDNLVARETAVRNVIQNSPELLNVDNQINTWTKEAIEAGDASTIKALAKSLVSEMETTNYNASARETLSKALADKDAKAMTEAITNLIGDKQISVLDQAINNNVIKNNFLMDYNNIVKQQGGIKATSDLLLDSYMKSTAELSGVARENPKLTPVGRDIQKLEDSVKPIKDEIGQKELALSSIDKKKNPVQHKDLSRSRDNLDKLLRQSTERLHELKINNDWDNTVKAHSIKENKIKFEQTVLKNIIETTDIYRKELAPAMEFQKLQLQEISERLSKIGDIAGYEKQGKTLNQLINEDILNLERPVFAEPLNVAENIRNSEILSNGFNRGEITPELIREAIDAKQLSPSSLVAQYGNAYEYWAGSYAAGKADVSMLDRAVGTSLKDTVNDFVSIARGLKGRADVLARTENFPRIRAEYSAVNRIKFPEQTWKNLDRDALMISEIKKKMPEITPGTSLVQMPYKNMVEVSDILRKYGHSSLANEMDRALFINNAGRISSRLTRDMQLLPGVFKDIGIQMNKSHVGALENILKSPARKSAEREEVNALIQKGIETGKLTVDEYTKILNAYGYLKNKNVKQAVSQLKNEFLPSMLRAQRAATQDVVHKVIQKDTSLSNSIRYPLLIDIIKDGVNKGEIDGMGILALSGDKNIYPKIQKLIAGEESINRLKDILSIKDNSRFYSELTSFASEGFVPLNSINDVKAAIQNTGGFFDGLPLEFKSDLTEAGKTLNLELTNTIAKMSRYAGVLREAMGYKDNNTLIKAARKYTQANRVLSNPALGESRRGVAEKARAQILSKLGNDDRLVSIFKDFSRASTRKDIIANQYNKVKKDFITSLEILNEIADPNAPINKELSSFEAMNKSAVKLSQEYWTNKFLDNMTTKARLSDVFDSASKTPSELRLMRSYGRPDIVYDNMDNLLSAVSALNKEDQEVIMKGIQGIMTDAGENMSVNGKVAMIADVISHKKDMTEFAGSRIVRHYNKKVDGYLSKAGLSPKDKTKYADKINTLLTLAIDNPVAEAALHKNISKLGLPGIDEEAARDMTSTVLKINSWIENFFQMNPHLKNEYREAYMAHVNPVINFMATKYERTGLMPTHLRFEERRYIPDFLEMRRKSTEAADVLKAHLGVKDLSSSRGIEGMQLLMNELKIPRKIAPGDNASRTITKALEDAAFKFRGKTSLQETGNLKEETLINYFYKYAIKDPAKLIGAKLHATADVALTRDYIGYCSKITLPIGPNGAEMPLVLSRKDYGDIAGQYAASNLGQKMNYLELKNLIGSGTEIFTRQADGSVIPMKSDDLLIANDAYNHYKNYLSSYPMMWRSDVDDYVKKFSYPFVKRAINLMGGWSRALVFAIPYIHLNVFRTNIAAQMHWNPLNVRIGEELGRAAFRDTDEVLARMAGRGSVRVDQVSRDTYKIFKEMQDSIPAEIREIMSPWSGAFGRRVAKMDKIMTASEGALERYQEAWPEKNLWEPAKDIVAGAFMMLRDKMYAQHGGEFIQRYGTELGNYFLDREAGEVTARMTGTLPTRRFHNTMRFWLNLLTLAPNWTATSLSTAKAGTIDFGKDVALQMARSDAGKPFIDFFDNLSKVLFNKYGFADKYVSMLNKWAGNSIHGFLPREVGERLRRRYASSMAQAFTINLLTANAMQFMFSGHSTFTNDDGSIREPKDMMQAKIPTGQYTRGKGGKIEARSINFDFSRIFAAQLMEPFRIAKLILPKKYQGKMMALPTLEQLTTAPAKYMYGKLMPWIRLVGDYSGSYVYPGSFPERPASPDIADQMKWFTGHALEYVSALRPYGVDKPVGEKLPTLLSIISTLTPVNIYRGGKPDTAKAREEIKGEVNRKRQEIMKRQMDKINNQKFNSMINRGFENIYNKLFHKELEKEGMQ